MSAELQFDQIRLPPECEALRQEVRAFLAEEIAAGTFDPHRPGHGDSHNRAFSRTRRRQRLDRHDLAEEIRRAGAHASSSATS